MSLKYDTTVNATQCVIHRLQSKWII